MILLTIKLCLGAFVVLALMLLWDYLDNQRKDK